MKKILLVSYFVIASLISHAIGEKVVVVTNLGSDGIAETPSELNPVAPCSSLLFKVNTFIPDGYVFVGKFDWFINGTSVKTTTDATDPLLMSEM
jgi:hypothetical protein